MTPRQGLTHVATAVARGLLLALAAVSLVPRAQAVENGFGLDVAPELPTQQRQGTTSYFDVQASPGEAIPLKVRLSNTTDEAITVRATVVPAQTSDSGSVAYQEKILHPGLLRHDMTDLVDSPHQSVTVPARGEVTYSTTLTLPSEAFEGLVAGGYHL